MKDFGVLILFMLNWINPSFGQNIFDKENSYVFAKSLACEGNYSEAYLALEPFVNYKFPDSLEALTIHCLYKLDRKKELFEIINYIFKSKLENQKLINQLGSICLSNDTFSSLYSNQNLDLFDNEIKVRMLLMLGYQNKAVTLIHTYPKSIDSSYISSWILRQNQIKKIKPGKYMLASALIPGTGKMFIGQIYEGLTTLLIVGTHTFLCIRSFQLYGITSAFGWVNVGLGTSFYGGNIIGTQRAIKREIAYQNQLLKNELKENIYSSFYITTCH
jgi:TM2 domain-containing membrane protein YozV